MSYKVIITKTAKQDLRAIALYIAEQSKNPEIAKRFVNELRNECERLQLFPKAGALPKDYLLRSAGHLYIVYKDYLIFYTLDEDAGKVYVLAIFNSKKDYMRVMNGFI